MGWWEDQLLLYSNSGNGGVPLFNGAGVDTFSTSNYISSATLRDFRPGQSLAFIFFCTTNLQGMAIYQNMFGCWINSIGAGKGWRMINQDGGVYFASQGSNITRLNTTAFPVGLQRCALTWRASDNHVLFSLNGANQVDLGALTTGTAVDNTCTTQIGRDTHLVDTYYTALTSGSVCSWAILNRELSSVEQVTLATIPLTQSRFSFDGTIVPSDSSTVFYFEAYKNWDGVSSTFTTLGSSPVTFTVTGSPNLTNYGEYRIATTDKKYFDSKISIPQTGYTQRECYARLRLSGVNGINIGYEYYNDFSGSTLNAGGIGLYINGTYNTTAVPSNYTPVSALTDFILPTGSNKAIDLWEGNQIFVSNAQPNIINGSYINYIRVPQGSTFLTPTAPQKRLVLLGDSIMSGFYPSVPNNTGITALLRKDFPTSGTGGVTCHCWGGNTLYNNGSTSGQRQTLANLLSSELDGTSANYLWIQLGTNDYGANLWSASSFGTAYADLLDKINALSPSTVIYCQTPFPRVSPSVETANGSGNTLSDYRTQITNAANARSSFCVPIDGTTIYANTLIYNASTQPTGRYYTDGLHNVDNGCSDVKSFIKTTLNY